MGRGVTAAGLSLQALAAEVTAQRARAQRAAKRTAMRMSGHRAPVVHVYFQLMDVEMMAHKPRTRRELAALCAMPSRTFDRCIKTLEDGGWIDRTRGGGRCNPTLFVTAIGKPLPPRPEVKPGRERTREWRTRKAACVTESDAQCDTE